MFLKVTKNDDVYVGVEKHGVVNFPDGTTYSANPRDDLTREIVDCWLKDIEPDEDGIPRRPPSDGEKEMFLKVMNPNQREQWVKKWGANGYSQRAWENYIEEHPEQAPGYLSDVRIEQEPEWWRHNLRKERKVLNRRNQ